MKRFLIILVFGYLGGCGLMLNGFIFLALLGYETIITTPLWWIEFLRSIGFVVVPV